MATEEYLSKFIASGKRYHELPDRFRVTVSEEEWRRRYVQHVSAAGQGAHNGRRDGPQSVHGLPPGALQTVCRVKDYCIIRGYSWVASAAQTACSEQVC